MTSLLNDIIVLLSLTRFGNHTSFRLLLRIRTVQRIAKFRDRRAIAREKNVGEKKRERESEREGVKVHFFRRVVYRW